MVCKVFDRITNKMSTLINHNGKWTSKFCKNVFVYKLGGYFDNVHLECSGFHPLCCIFNGYQNVPIT